MSTRHFFHDSEALVLDCLESLTLTNTFLGFDRANKSVFYTGHDSSKNVALISGGGAGHEPAHAGYVGEGLLTAAVSGSIFASPNVSQIVNTISRVGGEAGTILIIKNYTGDVFHFHLAAEKARANYGLKVEIIVVGDDVSVGRQKSGKVGRRGLAGTVLVHKILGAMSKDPNASLEKLASMGRLVASNLVTVGASLGHVHVPGRAVSDPTTAPPDQIELGMGIHNESGSRILNPPPNAKTLIDMMLDQLLSTTDADRSYVNMSDAEEIVLLINNLGGISVLELGGITKAVVSALESLKFTLSRVLSGTFMSSLDGPGFSITLLKANSEMLKYLDAPSNAVGWPSTEGLLSLKRDKSLQVDQASQHSVSDVQGSHDGAKMNVQEFKSRVIKACKNLIDSEARITEADTIVGDGDCGITLARGAKAVLAYIDKSELSPIAASTLLGISNVIEESMDGTSGALYSIFFNALASALRSLSTNSELGSSEWGVVASSALSKLQAATPARQGDRTLMDALEPFIVSFEAGEGAEVALQKAKKGVEATKGMQAAFGRAVYVEESAWSQVPDPGAEGILCVLEGLVEKS
ncbi:hypothetical protein ONS95_007520 [Cadophora gregata]|uniref:uncharacterized protein n=1 Tax=Cadophora gregata TaxID=51156 RepID=UPI0026DB5E93|nr:uncharacterized protein ONS95_007520 [Cadophora gregata]KAK0118639.1 hypothetical protein ONS96_011727 [Cadophora gregata f. sp. sojae]KAK0125895.1 hypothetical protein ONS95_007520 [Cadophora gregata]